MKKILVIIIILLSALNLSIYLLVKTNENYSLDFTFTSQEKNYIEYTVAKGEITNEFMLTGRVKSTENSIESIVVENSSNLTLYKNIGENIEIGEKLYESDGEIIKSNINGYLFSIIESDSNVEILILDYDKTYIEVMLPKNRLINLSEFNDIIIRDDENEYKGSIFYINHTLENDFVLIKIEYDGMFLINSTVDVIFKGDTIQDVYIVNKNAIHFDGIDTYIEVLDRNSQLNKIFVETGYEDINGNIQIISDELNDNIVAIIEFTPGEN